MNLDTAHSANLSFGALADPTRRAILARLARGEATVSEIAEPFPISGPAISRHLKVLEEAQLIARTRNGQQLICRLNPEGLKTAQEWLDQTRAFWSGAFDRLDVHLQKNPEKKK
jgi:DNA-binding transcriptional ArsR family regulator